MADIFSATAEAMIGCCSVLFRTAVCDIAKNTELYQETTLGNTMNNAKARILIVDDEEINIQVLGSALKSEYDIDRATNGHEAISRAKLQLPDLILLDVMMPELNGFEVCKILKQDEALAHIPVIFLTAMNSINDEKEGLKAGGIDYLTKPVNIDLVRLRVRNHIDLVKSTDIIRSQRDLLAEQKAELEASIARIKHLEGIIPICMYCKQIRDTDSSWHQLESYITQHSDAFFSHGICPACYEKEMGNMMDKDK